MGSNGARDSDAAKGKGLPRFPKSHLFVTTDGSLARVHDEVVVVVRNRCVTNS